MEADIVAPAAIAERGHGAVGLVQHAPAQGMHRHADGRVVVAVAEDVQEHPDARGVHADLADDAGLGQRLDAAAVGVLDRPHEPALAQLLVPVPRLHAQRAARRGGRAQAGDRRALPGGGGQELGARVQRADQLDVEAAAVRDAVDLLEQCRRPRRDAVEGLRAEPAQLVAGQADAHGEQAPVDVHHQGDALLLGAPERDAAGSRTCAPPSGVGPRPSTQHNRARPNFGVAMRVHAQGISSAGHARDRGSRRGRHVHRRRPDRRGQAGDGQGRDHRGRPLGRRDRGACAWRLRGRGSPPQTWRTSATAPRSPPTRMLERRGARTALRGHARLRRRARARPPGPSRTSTGPSWRRLRRSPRSRPRSTSGWGPAACCAPCEPASVATAARRLRRERVEAIAVCLLHAYADPSHEQAVAAGLRAALPGRARGGLARGRGRVPRVRAGLDHDRRRVPGPGRGPVSAPPGRDRGGRGPAGAAVMQSNGGRVRRSTRRPPIRPGCSCPGRPAASPPWSPAGIRDAISFDMGGTSTDVCLIRGGVAGRSAERRVGGLPLRLPQLDIHTVGAGGGSIAWIDPGGALRVGPRERRGRSRAGLLRPRRRRCRRSPTRTCVLGPARPRRAARRAGCGSTWPPPARALAGGGGRRSPTSAPQPRGSWRWRTRRWCARSGVVSVEQGHDPRELELVAFGGAGPLHACDVADSLGHARRRRCRPPAACSRRSGSPPGSGGASPSRA